MIRSTAALQADLDALVAARAAAMPAFDRAMSDARSAEEEAKACGGESDVDAEYERMSDAGVVRVLEAGAQLRRRLDAMLARVSDEVAKRSGPEFGSEGLAKQHGFHTPAKLVAATTGGGVAEAARLLAVGGATRTRRSFTGEVLPPKHPRARAALDAGALSIDAASLITGMFARVERRADPNLLDPYEATLVDLARTAPMSLVVRAVRLAETRLDPDGIEPADEALAKSRSVTLHEQANGMFRLRALLDPLTAAPVKAALDAMVGDALRRRGPTGPAGAHPDDRADAGVSLADGGPFTGQSGAPVIEDRRSIAQIQADALAQLANHVLGCADAPAPLIKTTVVVRMSLDALTDGIGSAEVDGIDRPVSAASARRLAADAELIPAVLGGESVPLDLGRSVRLFTRAQRIALAERDGGCASCGQNVTYAEAHHIDWWVRDQGPSDLANGVMLCSFCHHQVHREGWGIRAGGSRVWFIPPPHVDPAQRPRLGGRARFDPVLAELAPAERVPPEPAPAEPTPDEPAPDEPAAPSPLRRVPRGSDDSLQRVS